MFGRLGVLLTIIAVAVHFVAMVGRGMAADPNRVPWGNMYEFTMTGTFVVAFLYLALDPAVQAELAVTAVPELRAGRPDGGRDLAARAGRPDPQALSSYWLVIHVVSAIIATGAFTLGGMTSVLYLVKEKFGGRSTRLRRAAAGDS